MKTSDRIIQLKNRLHKIKKARNRLSKIESEIESEIIKLSYVTEDGVLVNMSDTVFVIYNNKIEPWVAWGAFSGYFNKIFSTKELAVNELNKIIRNDFR